MRHLTPITPADKPHILAAIDANPKLASSTKVRCTRVIAGYLEAGGNLSDVEPLAANLREFAAQTHVACLTGISGLDPF